ncbi:MAG: phosphate/phosphite/phosphonate ABC transporter substrate-binding protein [Campylobacteraceae bacterium]
MKVFKIALIFVALITGLFAEFKLDSRYEDKNGDMVADTPTDKSKLVDPKVLIFSYTPVEDPSVYVEVWAEFLVHLEKVTGKKVQFFPVQSNAAQYEAMRSGRLHIAGINTGGNPLAVACSGFVPFAMMADDNNNYGYEMEIITYPGSGITKIEDLKGKKIAFTSQTSNSGYKAPSSILKSKFNLEAGKDFEAVFSGKHDNSIIGVANKDYPAAAIANSVLNRMLDRDVVKKEQLVTIYKSQSFPTTGYGYAYNLKPELQEKIKEAFFTFDWKGTKLEKEFASAQQTKFIPITFKEHWKIIRDIDEAMNVQYTCK